PSTDGNGRQHQHRTLIRGEKTMTKLAIAAALIVGTASFAMTAPVQARNNQIRIHEGRNAAATAPARGRKCDKYEFDRAASPSVGVGLRPSPTVRKWKSTSTSDTDPRR